jgi:5,5'-dehydrodivanillate O-demethylase
MTEAAAADIAHTGPGTPAGTWLRRFWQPVYRSGDLGIGRPVRLLTLGQHYTLYRGDSGAAFLLQDRCPHRQTQLSLGWVVGEEISCFYHGWQFSGAGQCTLQPAEKASFAAKVRIDSYPVVEYLGLIFAYLGEGAPPEFPHHPELENADADITVHKHDVPCNYFQRLENDLDELHVHFVHAVTTRHIGLDEMPEISVRETEYGIRREGVRSGDGLNVTRVAHFHMPNMSMVDLPPSPAHRYWTVTASWRVPRDDESMTTFAIRLKRSEQPSAGGPRKIVDAREADPSPADVSEQVLAGKRRIQDLDPDYPGLFQVQDNVALAGQGRIAERGLDRLGQSDKGVILLRRIYERELALLAAGKEPKAWQRPQAMLDLAITNVREMGELAPARRAR